MISFPCPHCGKQLDIPDQYAGLTGTCNFCQKQATVPAKQAAAFNEPPFPFSSAGDKKPSGMAIASLILGILSYCVGIFGSIPGIVTGHFALIRIKREPHLYSGSGLAIAGLVLSYLNLAILVFVFPFGAAVMLPALARAREAVHTASCQNNLKQMGLVFIMYAGDNNGVWPELSREDGRLMMDTAVVYPDYMTDSYILSCPGEGDPGGPVKTYSGGPWIEEMADDHSYFYLGYAMLSEEDLGWFAAAYKELISHGGTFSDDLTLPPATGSADKLYRLSETAPLNPNQVPGQVITLAMQAQIPVMIERLGNHIPSGGNVLFMDGHVEFIDEGTWPMTRSAMDILESLDQY
jgi:prepilin-type processing-associated H-X9-DG protein